MALQGSFANGVPFEVQDGLLIATCLLHWVPVAQGNEIFTAPQEPNEMLVNPRGNRMEPMPRSPRQIDWYRHTCQSLAGRFPDIQRTAPELVERLSFLLLERLPADTACALIDLLPNETSQLHFYAFRPNASPTDRTNTDYIELIETVTTHLGERVAVDTPAEDLADAFLWAISQELPPEIKNQLMDCLPSNLQARMNINAAYTDDSKVA